jgi:carboxyl-terminal processing protease
MSYLDKHREELLNAYPDFEMFKSDFEVDAAMYDDFLATAEKSKVTRSDEDEYYYPEENIKIQLKALMARNLWDVNAYFQVINKLDDELKSAVELLEDGSMFSELKLD